METESCSVRLCRSPAVGESPVTCQPLCDLHMQQDFIEVDEAEARVAHKVQLFKKYQEPMRLMQQRLTSDLQLLDDTFTDLRETLDRCQSELVAVVTKQHDQLMDHLSSVSELEDFEKELKRAKDDKNTRQAFLINRSMEGWLKTLQLDSNLVRLDEESQTVEIAAYPDLNSRIRELETAMSAELVLLRKLVEQFDAATVSRQIDDEVVLQAEESKIEARRLKTTAACLTVCSNTTGFFVDESGVIEKTTEDCSDCLPQPSIFVAVQPEADQEQQLCFERLHKSSSSPKDMAFKILLLSDEAKEVGRLSCSWEADQPIRDLHCDNERQLLFIAQEASVTVTDLSGALKSRIGITELREGTKELCCIAGNCDKLFTLVEERDSSLAIVGVEKDSGKVQLACPIPRDCELVKENTKMSVRDQMLFLSDRRDVFTVCIITNKLINSRSLRRRPWQMPGLCRDTKDQVYAVAGENSSPAEFQLAICAPSLTRKPISKTPQYILSSDAGAQCKVAKVENGRVIVKTCRIDCVNSNEDEDEDEEG
ncbi:hypothetical protein BOX15_Mlig031113g1 [Macrostomum lignano]|uniref:Uncharacterized protein n=1 Tax=Macrostomum lignano TaxID=282301 RepID=A0A267FJG6_9PLAT|nr:hypothetical protein BOX15_Mlig031113g1 [Macrostomum lignano]